MWVVFMIFELIFVTKLARAWGRQCQQNNFKRLKTQAKLDKTRKNWLLNRRVGARLYHYPIFRYS